MIIGNLEPENKWQGEVIRSQNYVIGGRICFCFPSGYSRHPFKVIRIYENNDTNR